MNQQLANSVLNQVHVYSAIAITQKTRSIQKQLLIKCISILVCFYLSPKIKRYHLYRAGTDQLLFARATNDRAVLLTTSKDCRATC